ncbi:MAG: NAD-dependent dehydratase [Pseudoxanthomonas sp.]
MKRVLLAGASGMVGREVLRQALADPRIGEVVAPTRRPLAASAKLLNPRVDFDALPADAAWWEVDAAICTLGTTIREAGSQAAFRKVDHDYPLAVARHALAHGASTFVLTSASGANADSRIFYSRTKGELERDLRELGYRSLTLVRPGLLGGERERRRPLEHAGMKLLGAVGPLLPRRYRVVPASQLAATLLQAALGAQPGVRVIESEMIGVSS